MRRVVLVLVLIAVAVPGPPAGGQSAVVRVDPDAILAGTNDRLAGVGWNAGAVEDVVGDGFAPPAVRIDASLQAASPAPGVLDLSSVEDRVSRIRAVGAEPLVILSYMPVWLGAPNAFGRDPTRVAPADLDAWEDLVYRTVSTLAPLGAHRYEVWNEPDIPIFWQDTLEAFLRMAARTHRAVERVSVDLDVPLAVGGPATAFPDPAWILPYVAAVRAEGLRLDFVSWHYYGNYPFIGPDGAEGTIPEPIRPVAPIWGQRNPATTPMIYGWQTGFVRGLVDAALAGSGYEPELWITEWNLSAGGLDVRHGTHVGAAFDAAVLVEMERAGLDAADFYRASDDPGETRPGDWGLVRGDGTPKPAWWTFWAWTQTSGSLLEVEGDDPSGGLWARASRSDGGLDVLLVNFRAAGEAARDVRLAVTDHCALEGAEIRGLDEGSSSFVDSVEERSPPPDGLDLELGSTAILWVRFPACGLPA